MFSIPCSICHALWHARYPSKVVDKSKVKKAHKDFVGFFNVAVQWLEVCIVVFNVTMCHCEAVLLMHQPPPSWLVTYPLCTVN